MALLTCLAMAAALNARLAISGWREGYKVYHPNVTRGFVVDASQTMAPLQENHDATIQWFDGHFVAAFNGASNASEIARWQLNRVAFSKDGISWGNPVPLFEAGCSVQGESCQQWQPSMAVIQRPAKPPALWAFWCQFQGASTHTANFSQSAWFMSTLESGSQTWAHRRFDAPTSDTRGRKWILFPTQDPVQLGSGRVLIPVSMMPNGPTNQKGGVSSVLYTDDFGLSFQLSPGTPDASVVPSTPAWEPDVWEDTSSKNQCQDCNSTVHMIFRAVSYGVRSDQVLQHSVSRDHGCTWESVQVLPIESVPNRPGIGSLPKDSDGNSRMLMLDSDWSPRSTVTSVGESCRFNLAMFFAKPGDGPRFTAGFGFSGDEDFVMYPQWAAINNSLYIVYSQGMVKRSIKYARVHPLPDAAQFYVFPRSPYVGNGGRPIDHTLENELQLCGGSAGLDLDPINRTSGDIVHVRFGFSLQNWQSLQDLHDASTNVAVITVGDALSPLRLQVLQNLSLVVSIGSSEVALQHTVKLGQRTMIAVDSGRSFTNVSVLLAGDSQQDDVVNSLAFVAVPHTPSNTWIYLGEGFSSASAPGDEFFVASNQTIKPARAENFTFVSRFHPVVYSGPGCSELPRSANATIQDVVDSCFAFSANIEGAVAFWVYYHRHLDADHTRCCPKKSYSTKGGWRNQTTSDDGGFYQLTDFVRPSPTTKACIKYDLTQLQTRVISATTPPV